MLSHIFVKNLAVVEHLSLDLTNGMTVITGETGAGKSMLIDALSLAFGERADNRAIRTGCDKAEISLNFDLAALPQVQAWLENNELDAEGDCITRRILVRDGRSKAYINGHPTPIGALKTLGDMMIDIHSQHAHQHLLKREQQLTLLDEFGQLQETVSDLTQCYKQHKILAEKIQALQNQATQETARMALIQYQIEELEALNLTPNEYADLTDEQLRLANADHLIRTHQAALTLLYDHDSHAIHSQLSQVQHHLMDISDCDNSLSDTNKLINDALIAVSEARSNLREYGNSIDLDPQRLVWVEDRLAEIRTIARKHQVAVETIHAHMQTLKQEKNAFDHIADSIEQQQTAQKKAQHAYQKIADTLSQKRQQAAQRLSRRVTQAIKPLGMVHANFLIDIAITATFSAKGQDQITFLVSTNKGQPPQALSKVVSGGELSRISLAIQVEAARYAKIPTLVFDEVDVGIGGGVAEIVGKLIRTLGENRQVICITHLPQVACQGHHHLMVTKSSDQHAAKTQITALSVNQRIQEVARMLGGLELTEQTIAHATEMLGLKNT